MVHQPGSPYGSIYLSDMLAGRFSQGAEGANPLPTHRYAVTQADRDSKNRRKFGNQPMPTTNVDEPLVAPVIDWAERSAELQRTG